MAFAIVQCGTAINSAAQAPTLSFTPPANSELFIVASAVAATTPAIPGISDDQASSYTAVPTILSAFNTTNRGRVVRTSIGGSPVAMVVTCDWSASPAPTNSNLSAFAITGHLVSGPVVASSNVGQSGGSNATPTSPAAPAMADATNMQILMSLARRSAADTNVKAGYTELYEIFGANNDLAVHYRIGDYDASPNCTLAGAALWWCGSMEIAIAAAVAADVQAARTGTKAGPAPRNPLEILLAFMRRGR